MPYEQVCDSQHCELSLYGCAASRDKRGGGVNEKKQSAKDILISPTPVPCEECQAPTYFMVFRPWKVKEVCPQHLLPVLRKGSYTTLLDRLWSAVYHYQGTLLFEPQQTYWETLSLEQKWLQVGQFVHAQASASADEAIKAMQIESEAAS
jgi:hypothetical protein